MRLFTRFGRGIAARAALAALMAVTLLPSAAWAQSQASTGQISGTVLDQQGAAVKATVKVKNSETGLEQTKETDSDGLYRFVLLPPGTYTVTASASGFQDAVSEGNQVVVGRSIDIPLTLGISGVTEQVTVTAGEVEVQTTRSEPDAVIDETAIDSLPINGRRFQDFVTLTPTAQVDPQRGQISLAGQRGINSNINVDGVDYNNPFFGGIRGGERSNFAPTVPQESIREFQVVASGYSAEFGRSTGGVLNAVTKSGTNNFHGSAFYLLRHKELARGNEFFDALAEGDPDDDEDDRTIQLAPTRQQWGASFGGPIAEDRLFFFGAYEQQRVRIPRAVLFPNLNTLTPTSTVSLADVQEAVDFFRSLEGPFRATNDSIVLSGRGDWNINDENRVNLRFNWSDNEAINGVNTGDGTNLPFISRALSNDGTEKDRTYTLVGQAATFFSPSLVNELRAQWSYEERPRLANASQPTVNTAVGTYGTVSFLPTIQDDTKIQIADNITWSHGDHTAKFGVDFNYVDTFQTFGFNQFGSYLFSAATIDQLEILSLGGRNPDRFDSTQVRMNLQVGNLRAGLDSTEIAFFGQDSWRIVPNFTLNFGLRWEGQYNPDPEATNVDLVRKVVEQGEFPIGVSHDPSFIPDVTDQWAPRLGFAWDPFNDSKTVVRGYGGIYYARTPLLLFAGPINNYRLIPGDVSITLPFPVATGQPRTLYDQLLLIGIDLNDYGLGNLPVITPDQALQLAEALGFAPDLTLNANVTSVANDFRNPRSYQFGFGFERELMEGFTGGVDFSYVKTVNLERNRDLNVPAPRVLTSASNATDQIRVDAGVPVFFPSGVTRPIPTLRQVQIRESSGKGLYRALTFRAKYDRGWAQFNAFYVYSRNLTDDDNERSAGGTDYVDAFNLAPEYGPSFLDRRHQFTASPVFFLPWDFRISSAIRFNSGLPFSARVGTDLNQDFTNNDRPYLAPGVQMPRNSFRHPGSSTVDVRIDKTFKFGETHQVVLSTEIFNLFNATNIRYGSDATLFCEPGPLSEACVYRGIPTNPNFMQKTNRNPTSSTFGQILTTNSAGAPFQAQVGLRYEF